MSLNGSAAVTSTLTTPLGPAATVPAAPAATGPTAQAVLDTIAGVDAALGARLTALGSAGLDLTGHTVTLEGALLVVDGEVKLHPKKLAALSDDDTKKLFKVTKALEDNGGTLTGLSKENGDAVKSLTKSGGARLRFQANLNEVAPYLMSIDAITDPTNPPAIFASMTDSHLTRLWDLPNSGRKLPKPIEAGAQAFALAQAGDPFEFVEFFELYLAKYAAHMDVAKKAFQAAVQVNLEQQAAAIPQRSKLKPDTNKAQQTVYQARYGKALQGGWSKAVETEEVTQFIDGVAPGIIGQHEANLAAIGADLGTSDVDTAQPDAELVAAVRRLPKVNFLSAASASYHVEKHYEELPTDEQTGAANRVRDFLTSAQTTIRTGTDTVSLGQDGSRSVIFLRDAAKMRAIVRAANGKVFIATYMKSTS